MLACPQGSLNTSTTPPAHLCLPSPSAVPSSSDVGHKNPLPWNRTRTSLWQSPAQTSSSKDRVTDTELGVGKDLWRSPSPHHLPKQDCSPDPPALLPLEGLIFTDGIQEALVRTLQHEEHWARVTRGAQLLRRELQADTQRPQHSHLVFSHHCTHFLWQLSC